MTLERRARECPQSLLLVSLRRAAMMARYPCPPAGSQTSHGELQRLDAACDTGRRSGFQSRGRANRQARRRCGSAAFGFLSGCPPDIPVQRDTLYPAHPLHSLAVSLAPRARANSPIYKSSTPRRSNWRGSAGDAAPLPSRGPSFGLAHASPACLLEVTADQHPYNEREHFHPVGFPRVGSMP